VAAPRTRWPADSGLTWLSRLPPDGSRTTGGRREYPLWKAIERREPSRVRMWFPRVTAETTWQERVRSGVEQSGPIRTGSRRTRSASNEGGTDTALDRHAASRGSRA